MQLIVHIGTGKTGTSSIQKTLGATAAVLKQSGVAYIGLMGEELPDHHFEWQKTGAWPQLTSLGVDEAQQQLSEMLQRGLNTLQESGFTRVIWSNESIFGNHRIVLPVLEKLQQQGVEVSIIVYLRRHDAWVRSAYFQWGVKHKTYKGPIKPFSEWYQSHRPNFFSGLKPWLESSWHDISVRNYDLCGDIVSDFMKYCELNPSDFQVTHDNETPNAVALALWAIYNTQFADNVLPVELQRMLRQAGLLNRKPLQCDWNALLPTAEQVADVALDAVEDRRRLDEVLAQHGQPPLETSNLVHKDMSVSQGQINAALLLILKNQSDQIESLKRNLAQLKTS